MKEHSNLVKMCNLFIKSKFGVFSSRDSPF